MEYQLEMTFETSFGDKVNLTIRNCKSDINEDQIKALMDTIIAKNIITSPNINKKPNPQVPIKNVAINNINIVIINKIICVILLSIKENDFFAIKNKETLFEPLAFV